MSLAQNPMYRSLNLGSLGFTGLALEYWYLEGVIHLRDEILREDFRSLGMLLRDTVGP